VVFNIFKKGDGEEKEKAEAAVEKSREGVAGLLQMMVEKLVDNPDDVVVTEVDGETSTILELKVNEADMGKVIGKKGRIIKALRVVIRAAAVHQGKNVSIELLK
jgi:predicted RNA-binding protein YlqC (UPF0109 family)